MISKKKSWSKLILNPPSEDWIKINVATSEKYYKIRFNRIHYERESAKIIMARGKHIADCPTLVDVYVAVSNSDSGLKEITKDYH